jgi:hypothetical protein
MADQKPPVPFYSEKVKGDAEKKPSSTDFQEFKHTDPNDATIVT